MVSIQYAHTNLVRVFFTAAVVEHCSLLKRFFHDPNQAGAEAVLTVHLKTHKIAKD